MLIEQIHLRNWKNFSNVSAPCGDRVFLIGPNASGKSNFLDALRFLRDVSRNGLAQAVGERGGISAIRCLAARRYSDIVVEVKLADVSQKWSYRLALTQDQASRPVIREEKVVNLETGKELLNRPDDADEKDKERLTQTALEQVTANKEFRGMARFFETISYQHIIPQAVRDPKGFSSVPVQNDPFGRDFLLRLWNTQARTRDSRLRKITRALQVAVPQLNDLVVEMDHQGTPHLRGKYEHWRLRDAMQYENQFSDGTLRLFGLLWVVFEGSGPLLLEEPELSLHTEVVRYLPQMFERIQKHRKERRQIFISTHSEEMLSDTGIGGEEVLRLEPGKDGSQVIGPDKNDIELLNQGMPVSEVMLPRSSPKGVDQLSFLFGD